MEGRMRLGALATGVMLLVGALPASAVIKCRNADGQIGYYQTRTCPSGSEPIAWQPPQLGRIDSQRPSRLETIHQPPKDPDPQRRTDRRRARAAAVCAGLQRAFAETNQPCRGVDGCRQRQHRRDAVRARYLEQRCAFLIGDIDSGRKR